ncbi:transposase [Escherichia coli]|nr:transposase [Escherichia coli]
MISLPAGSRIWLVAGITDMRKWFLTAWHQKFRTS